MDVDHQMLCIWTCVLLSKFHVSYDKIRVWWYIGPFMFAWSNVNSFELGIGKGHILAFMCLIILT